MDFSKFKTNDWLIVGGGVGMLIFGTFVDWLSAGPFSAGNAFDFFFTGTVPWILVVGAAVITVLLVMDKISGSTQWSLILVLATVLAAILLLIRLIFNPGAGSGVDRGTGMYLSVLSGIVAAAGAVMSYTASGGDLKDLTDPNKLKAAFSSGSGDSTSSSTPPAGTTDDMPPPPPPPSNS